MISKDKCTGCSACKYSCPTNAIEMKIDDLTGFKIASVDIDKCINCGGCESICPQLKDNVTKTAPKRYALRMSDPILKKSSSGGAFTLLASYLFRNGFKHIVGVKWDENFNAVYSIATTSDEWREFRGSKYVQADTRDIFQKVKDLLDGGIKVLFTGIPCHIAGLLNYLGKKYDNLVTIDILCNSLPSPIVWRKWLKEEGFDTNDIESINMRHKNGMGNLNPTLRITKTDDSIYDINLKSTDFYRLTIRNRLLVNKSCYSCKFRKWDSHVSDFTIGDIFILRNDIDCYDANDSNLSIIGCNSKKSISILKKAIGFYKNSISWVEPITFGLGGSNPSADILQKLLKTRSLYFKKISNGSELNPLIKNLNKKYPYDVAIAGGTMCNNFGGALTYYALYKYIESLELKPVIIPPTPDSLGTVLQDNIFEKHCNIAPNYHKKRNIDFNMLSNIFVIGSDQMWNRNLFKEWYLNPYLDFVFKEKKKIAYGVSYGTYIPIVTDKSYMNIKKLINEFHHISHREESGKEKTRKYYDRHDTTKVMDPVFLIDRKEYDMLIKDSSVNLPENYICCYDLGISEEGKRFLQQIVDGEMIEKIVINTGNYHKQKSKRNIDPEAVNPISVQDWLTYIKHSRYLLTNSFHGLCFALIYHKNFIYIGTPDDRIKELLTLVGMDHLIFDEFSSADLYRACYHLHMDINWEQVDNILKKYIEESKIWLNNALTENEKN